MSRRSFFEGTEVFPARGVSQFTVFSPHCRFLPSLSAASFCVYRSAVEFFKGTLRIDQPGPSLDALKRITQNGVDSANSYFASQEDLDPERVSHYDQSYRMCCVDPSFLMGLQGEADILGRPKLKVTRGLKLAFREPRDLVLEFSDSMLADLKRRQDQRPCVFFLWRPPVAVSLFCCPREDSEDPYFAIYDPRPRPEFGIDSAALYRFASIRNCATHIRLLFPNASAMGKPTPFNARGFRPHTADFSVNLIFLSVVTYRDSWKKRRQWSVVPPPTLEETEPEEAAELLQFEKEEPFNLHSDIVLDFSKPMEVSAPVQKRE